MSAHAAPTPRTIPWRWIIAGAAAVVLAAMALDATWRSDKAPRVTGPPKFNLATYGARNYPKVVAAIDQRAVAFRELAAALESDPDAAGRRYGVRQGSSPFNFSIKGTGVAGKNQSGLLAVKVAGAKGISVNVQVGPAINGTSLRDAAGFINFNQFINQGDYADAGTALNDQVKAKVLAGIDPASLKGKRIAFTGAFTYLAPTVMTITPVRLEVSG